MFVQKLKANSFRNFDEIDITFNSSRIFIKGENGSGKTNLIEAIYYLSHTRPFKVHNELALIKEGKKEASVYLEYVKDEEKHSLSSLITRDKKIFAYDEEKTNRMISIFGKLVTICYIPKSVYLFKGEPLEKRSFIDEMCSQIDNEYLLSLQRYKKLLKERNQAFIKDYDQEIINVYAEQLIPLAYYITSVRNKIFNEINPLLNKYYKKMFGESDIKLVYKTNCPIVSDENTFKEQMLKIFNSNMSNEHLKKQTLYGPHRDSFNVLIDSKDIATYGSQGQNRLATISLHLAKRDLYKKYLNQEAVLLLDDIISDLDDTRINNLLETVSSSEQVIITGTKDNKILKEFETFNIVKGKIEKE